MTAGAIRAGRFFLTGTLPESCGRSVEAPVGRAVSVGQHRVDSAGAGRAAAVGGGTVHGSGMAARWLGCSNEEVPNGPQVSEVPGL